jgi:hypothetical protein
MLMGAIGANPISQESVESDSGCPWKFNGMGRSSGMQVKGLVWLETRTTNPNAMLNLY